MHAAPAFIGQRQDAGGAHPRQQPYYVGNHLVGGIQQDIFSPLSVFVRLDAEQQLLQEFRFCGGEVLVANQYRLAFDDRLRLLQPVHQQGAAGAHDVEDGICQANAGSDLDAAAQLLNFHIDAFLPEKVVQDLRVARGNALAVKVAEPGVQVVFRDGKREAAVAETQLLDHLHLLVFFPHLVLAQDPDIGHSLLHVLGNVVVAKEEDLHGEVGGVGF